MSKPKWACSSCGQDFTRKTSAVRHNYNLHNGRIPPIPYTDYLVGRQSGQDSPIPARKPKAVANRRKGDMQHTNAIESQPRSENIIAPSTTTELFRDRVAEAVRNFIEVKKTYDQLCDLVKNTVYSYHQCMSSTRSQLI